MSLKLTYILYAHHDYNALKSLYIIPFKAEKDRNKYISM